MKKFIVLIHDDFEIAGNGTGNVADLQYLPALAFMNIAEKYNIKISFMVDVAHRLALEKYSPIPEIRVQQKLWDEVVLLMKDRGFDVQLHIHAQWLDATYKSGYFYLNSDWNLARYSEDSQYRLIHESIKHLESLFLPTHPEHKICAFKAGAWGLQPYTNLQMALKQHGIRIILGPRSGLFLRDMNIDYTSMEEKYLPYYADPNDVTKISSNEDDMIVIPLQPFDVDVLTFTRFKCNRIIKKLKHNSNRQYYNCSAIPKEIDSLRPLKDLDVNSFSLHPCRTHLNIGGQHFPYLKKSFDSVISRLRQYNLDRIPILIESHTKGHNNYFEDIERFFFYIADNYESEVEFSDLSTYCDELDRNPKFAISKRKNEEPIGHESLV